MSASWRPTASIAALRRRAQLLARARAFFAARQVLEVQTPALSAAGISDPQIESLRTAIAGIKEPFFLNTSPEFAMKRLLAAGSGDIFQICNVFRDGEIGRWHEPEFTLIEWYRIGFDDDRLMTEVAELLHALLAPERRLDPPQRLTYREVILRYADVDMNTASDQDLADAAIAKGVDCRTELDRDARLDLLVSLVAGPRLGRDCPTFVCDYPASQAALARIKPGDPPVAARFELYLDGVELANGFHELTDAPEQRRRFETDLALRTRRGQVRPPVDERLLAALSHGIPPCAGVALGFDRLVALSMGHLELKSAMSFSIQNA
jgi:lysyl-tRNA synthetase class 2